MKTLALLSALALLAVSAPALACGNGGCIPHGNGSGGQVASDDCGGCPKGGAYA